MTASREGRVGSTAAIAMAKHKKSANNRPSRPRTNLPNKVDTLKNEKRVLVLLVDEASWVCIDMDEGKCG